MNKKKIKEKIIGLKSEIVELEILLKKPLEEPKLTLIEKIRKSVNPYKEVCKELNIRELTISSFNSLPLEQRKKALTLHKILNIEKVFAEGWIKNWNNRNEYKYYPYYIKEDSGWRLYSCSYASPGAPAYYKTREIALFIGEIFKDIYIDFID